ncbi:hypothetical protein PsYK624_039810 [Phanerochaete sordida]|uniref:Uncharacterized protein n=1 Tax=Phanerochaete sordida TaxID=48140 RepID=A0A9P3LBJ5_9APHY|nr:hypothetical protein PsYK624_039810 [Phanerochaete sordida]
MEWRTAAVVSTSAQRLPLKVPGTDTHVAAPAPPTLAQSGSTGSRSASKRPPPVDERILRPAARFASERYTPDTRVLAPC